MKDIKEICKLYDEAAKEEADAAIESNIVHEKCEYWGLGSHDSMLKQQKILNTMVSDIIQADANKPRLHDTVEGKIYKAKADKIPMEEREAALKELAGVYLND